MVREFDLVDDGAALRFTVRFPSINTRVILRPGLAEAVKAFELCSVVEQVLPR
jgi:hypothetical protein